ncbi:restriction endonuclease subunit S [Enterococcus casseliflavus]|uniref:restriction endonuclease subunit S n=1 Tax=Enterococcus casseliflavus TaxID=37734 RepID=UPI003D139451
MSEKLVPKIRFEGFSDEWEQRMLGDVFSERSERSSEGELISVTINSGVVKASELDRKDNSSNDKSNYKKVEVGDIAYNSMRMWQGASGYSSYDGILSPAYTVIIPKEGIDSKFFAYDFKRHDMIQTFKRNSQGLTSDTWNLKFPTLKSVKVMVPCMEEQTKISNFFERLDTTITLHQRNVEQLKQLKKAYLEKIFSQQIRFSGFTENWEQRKLGDIFKKDTQKNKDIEFHSDSVISVAKMKLSPPSAKSSDEYMKTYNKIWRGNIAFEGHTNDEFPNGRFVLNDCQDGIVSHIYDVYSAIDEYDNEFMKRYINDPDVMRKILINATSSARMMKSLNSVEFLKQNILLPILSEQHQIGKFFYQLDQTITLHQRKLDNLTKLKKYYLQQMFI